MHEYPNIPRYPLKYYLFTELSYSAFLLNSFCGNFTSLKDVTDEGLIK